MLIILGGELYEQARSYGEWHPNGWKCLAPCIGICMADAVSPVLDLGGYAVGLVSANA